MEVGSVAEAELTQIVKYIEEREKTLSRYSDKLRRAVERIFNVFGDPDECQVCEGEEGYFMHFKYYYYDYPNEEYHQYYYIKTGVNEVPSEIHGMKVEVLERDEALESKRPDRSFDKERRVWFVFKTPNYHKFTPKVFVSIDVEDGVPFYTEKHGEHYDVIDEYYLAFQDHELVILNKTRYENDVRWPVTNICGVNEVSRECLKALVKSGRLLEFLRMVAEKLQKMNEEYGEVSEIAEKMAKAIEG
jgi:hypothetical protein